MTNLTHNSFLCIYFNSLHVSSNPVLIIRSPTQSDIYQRLYWYSWFSWWWARGCSKNEDNWNKYMEKNCASRWSFTMNHTRMHGQRNIKFISDTTVCHADRSSTLTDLCLSCNKATSWIRHSHNGGSIYSRTPCPVLPTLNPRPLHSIFLRPSTNNYSYRFVVNNTRVGTLIVATIYLQLTQNRYMFQSFTVLHCSHQHCVQPVASDV